METLANYISKYIFGLREYQRINNIEKECIINSYLAYHALKDNLSHDFNELKFLPCFVVYTKNDMCCIMVHMALSLDGHIVDPSYETYSIPEKYYFSSIADLKNAFSEEAFKNSLNTEHFKIFIDFIKLQDKLTKLNSMTSRDNPNYKYNCHTFAIKYAKDNSDLLPNFVIHLDIQN